MVAASRRDRHRLNVVGTTPGAALSARALECVSRGELGAGVYVLLTRA